MKKLINKPEDFVRESLAGMAIAHSDLILVFMGNREGNAQKGNL